MAKKEPTPPKKAPVKKVDPTIKTPGSVKAVPSKAVAKKAPSKPVSKKKQASLTVPVSKPVEPARVKRRHRIILYSFIFVVLLPTAIAGWYLWERATDQYHSLFSFSVRKEQAPTAMDFVGGLSQLSSGGSSDADVLYQYIQSQELISLIDKDMDLRQFYSSQYDKDPIFSLKPDATIEDLVDFWPSVVRIFYDRGTGILQLRVLAFDAEKAREIANTILDRSTQQINRLSKIARDDTISYTQEELDAAILLLTQARQNLTKFRLRTQIVDPFADLQGQMGLLNTMQEKLVTTLIDLASLRNSTSADDPRIKQAERQVEVIREQIEVERAKFGAGGKGPGGEDYATLFENFERLKVDSEFAEETYKSALAFHNKALAEARQQSRYLAAHIRPTLAESATYPRRWMLMGITVAFLIILWAIGILIYYSIRDRR